MKAARTADRDGDHVTSRIGSTNRNSGPLTACRTYRCKTPRRDRLLRHDHPPRPTGEGEADWQCSCVEKKARSKFSQRRRGSYVSRLAASVCLMTNYFAQPGGARLAP